MHWLCPCHVAKPTFHFALTYRIIIIIIISCCYNNNRRGTIHNALTPRRPEEWYLLRIRQIGNAVRSTLHIMYNNTSYFLIIIV